jgi:hypothetical protein
LENIFEHKDTILQISAINIDEKTDVGFYEVHFSFQTYNDSKEYVWKVNILTEEISPVNNEARQMLNNVDYYD